MNQVSDTSFQEADLSPHQPKRRRPVRYAIHETGAVRLTTAEMQTVDAALAILERKVAGKRVMFSQPATVKAWLQLHYGLLQQEVFGIILLDNRNRLIAHEQLFKGTVTQTSVYPREVARIVFEHNATAAIAVHNHPSGLSDPSQADQSITAKLKQALDLLDVRLLDHFIVAGTDIYSFAEHGLL